MGARDCALAHIAAAEKGNVGQRYLVGYHNLSYKEFMLKISDVIGKKSAMIALPKIAVRLLGHVGPYLTRLDEHRFAGLDPMSFVRCNSQDTEMAQKWFKIGYSANSYRREYRSLSSLVC